MLRFRFVREVAIMQGGKFVPLLGGLLSSILYARLLGLGGYGTYAVVLAFTGVIGLFTNLGQRFTTLTFLAEAYGRQDREAMVQVSRYYSILSIATMLLLGIIFFLLPQLSILIYGRSEIGTLAQFVFLASMLDPFYIFFSIALQTVREIRFLTIVENAYVVVQLGFAILFILQGMGPAGILLGSLVTSAISAFASLALYPRIARVHKLPTLQEIFSLGKTRHFWRHFKNGIWIAVDKSLSSLYPNVFIFALSLRSSDAVIGLIRLAFKFASLPGTYVLSNISRLASSVIPALAARGARFGRDLMRLLRYSFLLHIGVSLVTAIIVPLLFPYIYGSSFGPAMYPFWVILATQLILPLHAVSTPLFRMYDQISVTARANFAATVIGLVVFFTFAQRLPATWAFYIAICLYQVIVVLLLIKKIFRMLWGQALGTVA